MIKRDRNGTAEVLLGGLRAWNQLPDEWWRVMDEDGACIFSLRFDTTRTRVADHGGVKAYRVKVEQCVTVEVRWGYGADQIRQRFQIEGLRGGTLKVLRELLEWQVTDDWVLNLAESEAEKSADAAGLSFGRQIDIRLRSYTYRRNGERGFDRQMYVTELYRQSEA